MFRVPQSVTGRAVGEGILPATFSDYSAASRTNGARLRGVLHYAAARGFQLFATLTTANWLAAFHIPVVPRGTRDEPR